MFTAYSLPWVVQESQLILSYTSKTLFWVEKKNERSRNLIDSEAKLIEFKRCFYFYYLKYKTVDASGF